MTEKLDPDAFKKAAAGMKAIPRNGETKEQAEERLKKLAEGADNFTKLMGMTK